MNALSYLACLITSHIPSSSMLFNANFISLKLSFFHCTIILSSYWASASYLSLLIRSLRCLTLLLIDRIFRLFGVHGTAHNRIKFCLSDPRFVPIKCSRDLSGPHQSCYGVPQGSLLRLLFTLYITPLSSLISSLPLDDHLCITLIIISIIIFYFHLKKPNKIQCNNI